MQKFGSSIHQIEQTSWLRLPKRHPIQLQAQACSWPLGLGARGAIADCQRVTLCCLIPPRVPRSQESHPSLPGRISGVIRREICHELNPFAEKLRHDDSRSTAHHSPGIAQCDTKRLACHGRPLPRSIRHQNGAKRRYFDAGARPRSAISHKANGYSLWFTREPTCFSHPFAS